MYFDMVDKLGSNSNSQLYCPEGAKVLQWLCFVWFCSLACMGQEGGLCGPHSPLGLVVLSLFFLVTPVAPSPT